MIDHDRRTVRKSYKRKINNNNNNNNNNKLTEYYTS